MIASNRGFLRPFINSDLILRSIAQRCVSKDGRLHGRACCHPSRRAHRNRLLPISTLQAAEVGQARLRWALLRACERISRGRRQAPGKWNIRLRSGVMVNRNSLQAIYLEMSFYVAMLRSILSHTLRMRSELVHARKRDPVATRFRLGDCYDAAPRP